MTTVQPATVYYNEIDPYCCQWLKNLIAAGELPSGDVDCRSIVDVKPEEVAHYTQRHWFAGLGGWPMALQLAGWGDRPVDTGSAPCQPFSAAGKRQGVSDPRHLWPEFFRLIRACRPQCVIGEQVGGAAGRAWLAGIHHDLATIGYQFGAIDLPACSVGAPHIRQRLFWVAARRLADPTVGSNGSEASRDQTARPHASGPASGAGRPGDDGRLAVTGSPRRGALLGPERANGRTEVEPDGHRDPRGLFQPTSHGRQQRRPEPGGWGTEPRRGAGGLAGAERHDGWSDEPGRRPEGRGADGRPGPGTSGLGDTERGRLNGHSRGRSGHEPENPGLWSTAILIPCADGRARRAQPGIFPLADGLPLALDGAGPVSRIGALRGAGNAIVPQLAALFIKAFMESMG